MYRVTYKREYPYPKEFDPECKWHFYEIVIRDSELLRTLERLSDADDTEIVSIDEI